MEKKSKKQGSLVKKRKVGEQSVMNEALNESYDGGDKTNGSVQPSPPLDNASPTGRKYRSRHAKKTGGKQAASITPPRHNEETLSIVMQALFGSKSSVPLDSSSPKIPVDSSLSKSTVPVDSSSPKTPADSSRSKSTVPVDSSSPKTPVDSSLSKRTVPMDSSRPKTPVQAQDLPSQQQIISPSKRDDTFISSETENQLVSYRNVPHLDKLTSDLLAQAGEAELPQAPDMIIVNNSLPEMEANLVLPPLDSTSSDHIDVEWYKVKTELAPLLKAIFKKYGDISKESMLSVESRPILLELVCNVYKKLEASTFLQLTPSDLKSMLVQLKDLQLMKIEIGWLHQRLSQISKAREMCAGVLTIEDVDARIIEKKKAIQCYEKEVEKLQEKLQQDKDKLGMAEEIKKLCCQSLVHELV